MRKLGIVALVGMLVLIVGLPGPAGASTTGATAFLCKVVLPVWPTPSGPQVKCTGSITGAIAGKTVAGKNYAVAPAKSPFTATAPTYSETCTFNEPLNGKANGTITATRIVGITPSGNASASGIKFVWTRIGATATIVLTGGTITLAGGQKAVGQRGSAVAVFVPNKLGSCTAPETNVTAQIVGATLFQS